MPGSEVEIYRGRRTFFRPWYLDVNRFGRTKRSYAQLLTNQILELKVDPAREVSSRGLPG